MATAGKDRIAAQERCVQIAVSLFLGLGLSLLSFWDLVTSADYPLLGSPTLVCGILLVLWGTSQSKKYMTTELWRIIAVFLVVAVWTLAVGVMISLLPEPIGEICSILSSWWILDKAKGRQDKL
ncbi:uncharacterized protein LOC135492928 [Lineus longissimus]|uniref:uncharacterized protein LOC135492928 n=1 Tax=Lineus longissimus TaxID=88925 RepID=UPI002B4CC367